MHCRRLSWSPCVEGCTATTGTIEGIGEATAVVTILMLAVHEPYPHAQSSSRRAPAAYPAGVLADNRHFF